MLYATPKWTRLGFLGSDPIMPAHSDWKLPGLRRNKLNHLADSVIPPVRISLGQLPCPPLDDMTNESHREDFFALVFICT